MADYGILYVCATPIGNLEDVTIRVLRVLREADLICAEDTRRTIKLLNRYEIKTPMTSFHEHNEREKAAFVLDKLLSGVSVALVSDAGLPAVSDPGAFLISACREKGIPVTVCPGASAGVTAFVAAGLTGGYIFSGFLPADKKERRLALERILSEPRPVILYEAPHRLVKTLNDMKAGGITKITICRELTKAFEEVLTATVDELIERYAEAAPKGEFVLIAHPSEKQEADYPEDISAHVESLISQGLSEQEAIKAAANQRGVGKREVYAAVKRKQ